MKYISMLIFIVHAIFMLCMLNNGLCHSVAVIPGDECPARFDQLTNKTEFGHAMLKYFQFEHGYVNLNHGAFGAAPKMTMDCLHYWQRQAQINPIRWIRHDLWPRMQHAANQMAQYLGVKDSQDLAFIPNVSAGINAILRSLHLDSSSVIVYFSEAFGTIKLAIQYVTDLAYAHHLEIPVSYPFEDEDILDSLETVLSNFSGRVKLISISHISAFPAVVFPVKEITRLGRLYGAMVMVDAAHVLGQMTVDLSQIDPDFYVCNGYKWFYTPQGSAVMYVKKEYQHLIHPAVISWNYNHGFQSEFHMQGMMDYSAYLTFPAAMEFRRRLGEQRIMNYIHDLAQYAGRHLAAVWGTEMLLPQNSTMDIAMVNVRLPVDQYMNRKVPTMVEHLLQSCHTFLAIFMYNGHWYMRISAQIYNEKSDYHKLAWQFLEIQDYLKNPFNSSYPLCGES